MKLEPKIGQNRPLHGLLSVRFLSGVAAAALLIGLCATRETVLALGSSHRVAPAPPACSYVRAGPSGPKGNVLRIKGSSILYRKGARLKVRAALGKYASVSCSDGVPTTTNVDRVHVIVDGSTRHSEFILDERNSGPLAPGATREPRGSEIEIAADFGRPNHALLKIWGARRGNRVDAVSVRKGAIGINLNRNADGRTSDFDLITHRTRLLKFLGGPGPDRVSGVGLRSFAENPKGSGYNPFKDRLRLLGKGGNDILLGSAGRDFLLAGIGANHFRGGRGNDLVVGGPGRDDIQLGKGSSTVYAGPGNDEIGIFRRAASAGGHDRLFGGGGNDGIISLNGSADIVNCGFGKDLVAGDRSDQFIRCERKDFPR